MSKPGLRPAWTRRMSAARLVRHPYTGIAVILLAALVRMWRLDFHSFWFDEAVSLQWATSDINYIWEKTFPLVEEKHPPAYYTLLHLWLRGLEWVGLHQADSPIRSLGALLGVITTWATLRLATRLSGPGVGVLTGVLVALSPLLVWYSQEARMFQPAATGVLCGALGLHAAWYARSPAVRLGWWLLMVGGLVFALYSYLFSAFLMPAAGLSLLLLYSARPNRGRLVEGLLALAVVTLIFLPLAQNAWGVNAAESTPGRAFENLWNNHTRLLQVLTVWRVVWPALLLHAMLLLWGVLLLLGLVPIKLGVFAPGVDEQDGRQTTALLSPDQRLDAYWLWLWLGVPLLIANVLLSRSGSIFNEDRYLIFLAPFALWAAARGAAVIARVLPPAGATLAVALMLSLAAALPQTWSPANYRENWRAAAQYIIDYTRATPPLTAAVVSHIEYTNIALQWYLRQTFTHDEMPVFFPFGGWINPARIEEDVAPPLRGIEDLGVDTLWLVQAHLQHVDADGIVEGWLQSTYPIVTELYPAGIKVTGHILRREYTGLPLAAPLSEDAPIEVAPGLYVHHCAPVFPRVAAQDAIYHPPSGWVHVQSWWSADSRVETDYLLRARVMAPDAIWGESLDRPAETLRVHPPTQWTPGAHIRAEMDINLNPITPPGVYAVEVRLEAEGAEFKAPCGTVEIE